MQGKTSRLLKSQIEQVMSLWQERALAQVESANTVENLALRDSLPLYLTHLSDALASNRKMDMRSVEIHDEEAVRIGKLHGADRARSAEYGLTEVIFEYHLLREVIFEVLETDGPLTQLERDIILDSIEQAVNDAAVKFTEAHAAVQQRFISTLTHDLRTPITAAKVNAQLIGRRPDNVEMCKKSANMIVASLGRLDTMIHDLLDVGRLGAGAAITFAFSDGDLEAITRGVVAELALIHGDRFVVQADGDFRGNWACDGLRRAMENLLGNAIKYSTPQTLVTVYLRQFETQIEIEVHNLGAPIRKEDQVRLFEAYSRTKSAEKGTAKGWGVGLTLVKGVVAAQKGVLRVKSDQGEGTSFIIAIPRDPALHEIEDADEMSPATGLTRNIGQASSDQSQKTS